MEYCGGGSLQDIYHGKIQINKNFIVNITSLHFKEKVC